MSVQVVSVVMPWCFERYESQFTDIYVEMVSFELQFYFAQDVIYFATHFHHAVTIY